jgi:hypothetical protein
MAKVNEINLLHPCPDRGQQVGIHGAIGRQPLPERRYYYNVAENFLRGKNLRYAPHIGCGARMANG